MIEMGKKYQTRDGRPVEILRVNVKNAEFPVVGIITECDGSETQDKWTAEGYYHDGPSKLDLVPVPEKHEAWVVCRKGSPYVDSRLYPSREDAGAVATVAAHGNDAYVIAHLEWED